VDLAHRHDRLRAAKHADHGRAAVPQGRGGAPRRRRRVRLPVRGRRLRPV
ncbi:uncharacterized protein METZ01_LOCUS279306, partial [marine metagenome]